MRVNEETRFSRGPRMLLSPLGLSSLSSQCLSKELHISLVCPFGCHRPFLGTIPGSSPQEEEGLGLKQSLTSDKPSLPFSLCHDLSKLHPWLREELYRPPVPAPTVGEDQAPQRFLLSLRHTTPASPGDVPLFRIPLPPHCTLETHVTQLCLLYHLCLDTRHCPV